MSDMNPCQGHILELKLAAIQTLEFEDFWLIFGEGRHPQFAKLLTSKLSPFLSSSVLPSACCSLEAALHHHQSLPMLITRHAYAYWKAHADQFSRNFYFRGYSGWALRLAQVAFLVAGVSGDVKKLCTVKTVEEQETIWRKKLRPILLNRVMVRGFLGNPCVSHSTLQKRWNLGVTDGQYFQLACVGRAKESDELFLE